MTSRYSRRNSDTTGDSTCGQGADPRSNNVTFSWRLEDVPAEDVLAVYGTLRPGRSNFDIVAPIDGVWLAGTIRGTLGEHPTGQYKGYPAFHVDPGSGHVEVDVLVSDELIENWARLDAFEGPGYRRIIVDVTLDENAGGGTIKANVYESFPEGEPPVAD